jgi:ferredoxin
MLTLYFSGTGNTKYLAELFSGKMGAECISIEADVDFSHAILAHDTLAFCYPIYNSRVPRIMRAFVHKHMTELRGKKVVILVTQMLFSGDGARVFTDLFEPGAIEVIYAEHFNMQQNMGNIPLLPTPTEKSRRKFIAKTQAKMNVVCENINAGKVKKRGFCAGSKLLGLIQGLPWQENTSEIEPARLEKKMTDGLRIHEDCNSCGVCVKICPMKNLVNANGKIQHQNNCTVCYRCVNRCPKKAITVYIHAKPRWQYHF